MKDLVAINGPWQAISFLNFFYVEYEDKEKPLCDVIFFEINEELQNVCKLIFSNYNFIDTTIDFVQYRIRDERQYNNLWIGKLLSLDSKKILESFSELPVILFEEGIHSYVSHKTFSLKSVVNSSFLFINKLKIIYKFFFRRELLIKQFSDFVMPFHVKRCKKKYYLLPLMKEKSNKDIVCSKFILEILQKSSEILKQESIVVGNKPCVLIIGQYFSNLGLLSFDKELSVYFKIIDYYLKQGFDVYWKGHPRNKNFDKIIKSTYKERIKVLESNSIPLEIFLISNSNIEVCGIASSALFYNALLLKNKTKQSLNLVLEHLNNDCFWYKDFVKIFSLFESNIEGLYIN